MTNEQLIQDYRDGNQASLNELAKQNRGLIASITNDWVRSERHWDDRFQDCSVAFVMAANTFEFSRGRRFTTYASVVMNRYMRNLFVERTAQKRTANLISAEKVCLKSNEPGPVEISALKIAAEDYLRLIPHSRARKIVWLAMQGYTNKEIAAMVGTTFQRVSQIKHEGLRLIREKTSGRECG